MNELYPPTMEFYFNSSARFKLTQQTGFDVLKAHPLSELFYSQFYTSTKSKKQFERENVAKRETWASFTCARKTISSQVESKLIVVILCLSEFFGISLFYRSLLFTNSFKMSLTLAENCWAWFYFLVHEILPFAAVHVLALEEVKMIASKVVKFIFHLPDLRFFDLRFGDGQRIGFAFCLS